MLNKNIIIIVLLIILILICRNNIFETFQQNDTVDLRGQLVTPYNLKTSDKYDIGNIVLDQLGKNSGLHSKVGEALDLATLSQYINDGIDGDKGVRGEKGNIGSKGPQGEPGIVKQGEFKVVSGDRGPKGEQGKAGTNGEKGSKGERGPAGTASQKGEKGEAGGTGPAGPRGEVGPTGPRGESGTRGPVGPAASYSSITQNSSGNIGIGPSGFDAQSKLHVNGHFILEDGNKNSVINTGENGNFYFRKLGANYAQNGQGGSQDLMVVKNDGNIGIGTSNPTEKLVVGGDDSRICIGETCINENQLKTLLRIDLPPKDYMYYPLNYKVESLRPIIYQNIFDAMGNGEGKFRFIGSQSERNTTRHTTANLWLSRPIIHFGKGGGRYNGAEVNVPKIGNGSMTLWLRLLNERWEGFKVVKDDGTNIGFFSSGYRNILAISPDGAAPERWWEHSWMPISIPSSGKYILFNPNNRDNWISGIAYSANPWNHACLSAISVHWKENGGPSNVSWNTSNWNNDILAEFNNNTNYTEIQWPCEPSEHDKLLYIIGHNNNWLGVMHQTVRVNGQQVNRFTTSFNNPFAVHINSKMYARFMGIVVPKEIIGNQRWINVDIDMTNSKNHIHFREIGSIDYVPN